MAPDELDPGPLLDSLDVAVVALAPRRDASGAIRDFVWAYANQAGLDLVGRTWDDIAGRTITEVYPDGVAARLPIYLAVYESGEAFTTEASGEPVGIERWLEVHVQRVDDLLMIRFTDITERHRLSVEKEGALGTVQQVLGRISDAMFAVDGDWRFTLVNPSAERILGSTADDLLGRNIWEAFPLAVGSEFETAYRKAVATGRPLTVEGYYPPPLDTWYRVRVYPDAEGLTAHFTDVGVERRVEERVAHFDRLESVATIAGGVAHDFNNLLMVVSGHTSFLADDLPPDHPGQADLQAIALATERATALTGQLLSYTSQQVVNPELVDLREAVASRRAELERRLPPDVRLDVSLGEDPVTVDVDPLELDRLIGHLVDNATQAMPSGGRLGIEVTTAEVDEETADQYPDRTAGEHAVLVVSDDGCGMAPEVRDRAVEPFFTTRRGEGGTGLGLSAVHGIARQAGGHVVVSSEPGQGTTVQVFLRCAAVEGPVGPDPSADLSGSETVLVVDDNADVALLIERSLSGAGFTVLVADGVEAAMDLVRARGPEIGLLVTDVVMPGMNGAELAAAIRLQIGAVPVLFVSGYAEESVGGVQGRHEGAEFLAKPFARRELLQRVRRLLDRSAT